MDRQPRKPRFFRHRPYRIRQNLESANRLFIDHIVQLQLLWILILNQADQILEQYQFENLRGILLTLENTYLHLRSPLLPTSQFSPSISQFYCILPMCVLKNVESQIQFLICEIEQLEAFEK